MNCPYLKKIAKDSRAPYYICDFKSLRVLPNEGSCNANCRILQKKLERTKNPMPENPPAAQPSPTQPITQPPAKKERMKIAWDAPASETISGAPNDQPLRDYVAEQIAEFGSEMGFATRLAAQISPTLRVANMKKRANVDPDAKQPAAEPKATNPAPAPTNVTGGGTSVDTETQSQPTADQPEQPTYLTDEQTGICPRRLMYVLHHTIIQNFAGAKRWPVLLETAKARGWILPDESFVTELGQRIYYALEPLQSHKCVTIATDGTITPESTEPSAVDVPPLRSGEGEETAGLGGEAPLAVPQALFERITADLTEMAQAGFLAVDHACLMSFAKEFGLKQYSAGWQAHARHQSR
jgi:hypothetical protein